MATVNWARAERQALSDLLVEVGPDAPTLCQGWTTAHLAAHLVIREHRPDALPGMVVRALAGHTERLQRQAMESTPYPALVERFRQGPPRWSPTAAPAVDALANTVEHFVHQEDVRRARAGWAPRALPAEFEFEVWRRLRIGALILRRLPVEITLAAEDGRTRRITKGARRVRVHGKPSELALWTLGRVDVAQVRLTGEAEAIDLLGQGRWRF